MSREPGPLGASPSPTEFLSRWSRRKAASRESPVAEPPVAPAQAPTTHAARTGDTGQALPGSGAVAAKQAGAPAAEPPVADDPIPPIDSLTESSDFSRFMRADVSAEIRKLALRKLFQSPIYNLRDGLDDYDDDYTSFEPLGDIVTADMRYHAEREQADRERAAAEAEQAAANEARADLQTDPAAAGQAGDDTVAATGEGADPSPAQSTEPAPDSAPPPVTVADAQPAAPGQAPLPGAGPGKLRRRQDNR
ncbi:MAG: DUF3306 domain-containing protein [Burkholderiaceae bacterium]